MTEAISERGRRELRAVKIDAYFAERDGFSSVPYRPIGDMVIEEVGRMGEGGLRLSSACALIEQESMGKNIFGCDKQILDPYSPPFCRVRVTEKRVARLLAYYYEPPVGGANGIGLTQLTSIGYVEEAEELGGAHIPRFQCRVGFALLNGLIGELGWPEGAAAYNAGRGNWQSVMKSYGREMQAKERQWATRLEVP